MKKAVLFAMNGEMMCFVHVMLNALDMLDRGFDVRVVFEGASVKLVPELVREDCQFHNLFKRLAALNVVDGACKACSKKFGVADAIEAVSIPLIGDMGGHPPMGAYMAEGFEVITF